MDTQETTMLTLSPEEIAAAKPDYEREIIAVIRGKNSPKALQSRLGDYHANDIAAIMPQLAAAERKKLYRVCDVTMLAEICEHLEEKDAGSYLNEMDLRKAAEVVAELETDTAATILRVLGKEKRSLIIDAINPEIQKEIRLIASFDDDEIGSKMTTNCIIIRENLTIKQAMHALVEQAKENDNVSTVFVVDEHDVFYGAIDLKDLIIARREEQLENLIATSFPYVYAHESIDDCIERLKDYSEDSIPVLDNANRLLGVITAKNIIEVVDDEMGEDYARLAGLTAEEDLREPLLASMKKRMPWLLILLGLGLLVSSVVGVFEQVVQQLTLIMAFQSLILEMAGNVGTQSLAVTIRVLVDENLTFGQKLRLVLKETKVGLCNGLLLGILSFVMVGLYIMLLKKNEAAFSFLVSGCIGVSLLLAILISSVVGTLVPLMFKKLKVDPAVASGPLITTINDLVAVIAYYGTSWVLLIKILGFGS